jgi:hypothetical protein
MITKLWQLKGVFAIIGLIVAFAACVKEKDPNLERNQIKDALTAISSAISGKDLQELNKYYIQPAPEGNGPNALLSAVAAKGDSTFVMHGRKFSIDGKNATVRFAFTADPDDTIYSYLYLVNKSGWKISNYDIK